MDPPILSALVAGNGRELSAIPALLAPSRAPLTQRQLVAHTRAIANAIRHAGVEATDRVAVVMPNGPEMATSLISVACAAVCAPLNPTYTIDEFRFHFSSLRIVAVMLPRTERGPAREAAVELGVRCIDVQTPDDAPAGMFRIGEGHPAEFDAFPARSPDDIALVLHTSGTTAKPKVVPLTHSNLCHSARNVAASLALSPSDRCLNLMPLFHIHGIVAALLASLVSGGSVACTGGYRDECFLRWLDDFEPTWTTAVPSIYQAILSELDRHPPGTARGRLRLARSSSAPLPATVMRELEAVLGAPVIEAYGMTEAAHQITSNPLPPVARKPGSVGLPGGPDVRLMDDQGRLLDHGDNGEIVIRGPNVTPGYEHDDEANAKSFADGWLRTGDHGYMDRDGYLFLTGRRKEIINRGGEKVVPREIDEALMEHPAVRQCVAFAVPHSTLGEDVAAAVVLRAGHEASGQDLRHFLFGRLAQFKIPSQLVVVDTIPKSATGKVQRIGMASKLADRLTPEPVPPRDADEATIARIFRDVLGTPQVGALDNFFALGGDSLRGFQVLARIREHLRADLSILELFKAPTVAELAQSAKASRQRFEESRLEQVLSEVEAMSEQEASRALGRKRV